MPTTVIGTEKFREEAQRRLIDTWGLMMMLGLRSRQGVWDRVASGKLPEPIVRREKHVALWDLDEVTEYTDREEG